MKQKKKYYQRPNLKSYGSLTGFTRGSGTDFIDGCGQAEGNNKNPPGNCSGGGGPK